MDEESWSWHFGLSVLQSGSAHMSVTFSRNGRRMAPSGDTVQTENSVSAGLSFQRRKFYRKCLYRSEVPKLFWVAAPLPPKLFFFWCSFGSDYHTSPNPLPLPGASLSILRTACTDWESDIFCQVGLWQTQTDAWVRYYKPERERRMNETTLF